MLSVAARGRNRHPLSPVSAAEAGLDRVKRTP
jgi:hypothetical protein